MYILYLNLIIIITKGYRLVNPCVILFVLILAMNQLKQTDHVIHCLINVACLKIIVDISPLILGAMIVVLYLVIQ